MRRERKRLLCKLFTIVGSILILLPNGVAMYWGNLSVYASSYIVISLRSPYGIDAPWVISLYILFWTLAIMAYDTIRNQIGKRCVSVLGCICTELGILASYFTVQTSFVLLNFTIAVLTGIGTGFLHAHLLRLLVDWANNDMACLISILQGSFYWGAAIINQLITIYLNPSNATPNMLIRSYAYFTQKKILDKVPSLFLVLGGFSVACHFIGYCLLRDNVFDKLTNPPDDRSHGGEASESAGCSVDNNNSVGDVTTSKSLMKDASPSGYSSLQLEGETVPSSISKGIDYTPTEVLKTVKFYVLWVSFFFAEYPFILLGNYYKSFGQIWIHDDYFLTSLGTSLAVMNIWMRLAWGLIMGRIRVRNCLSLQISLVALVTEWFYFTAIFDKWLYFIVTNVLSALSGALFSSISVAAVALFGEKHFSTNFGLLRSSSVILSIVCPFVTEAILKYLGWFYIFSSAAFVNIISLILMLFCFPQV